MEYMFKKVLFFILVCCFSGSLQAKDMASYLSYEQKVILAYAIHAFDATDEVKKQSQMELAQFLKQISQLKIQKKQVKNFDEFLNLYRGDLIETHSMGLNMAFIHASAPRGFYFYESNSPRVQNKINQYLEQQISIYSQTMGLNTSPLGLVGIHRLHSDGIASVLNQVLGLEKIQESDFEKLAQMLIEKSQVLIIEQMQTLEKLGEKISQSQMVQSQDKMLGLFLGEMFSSYFANLSMESKKLILYSALNQKLNMSDMEKFELLVQNSGPQLQKMLQVVARQKGLSSEMIQLFKKLESTNKSVPWSQVQLILQNEKSYSFSYFERKPLGVGTMAQVHRAQMLIDGIRRDVVVRFIKPGIQRRVQEDHLILKKVAEGLDSNPQFISLKAPKLSPIIDDVTETVKAELSQEDTIARQLEAKKYYEKEVIFSDSGYKSIIQFQVPDVVRPQKGSQLFVQQMVFGKKLDKVQYEWEQVLPQLKLKVVEAVAQLWTKEVMFGSGFYHSDLHQGNFIVSLTDEAIKVNLLDYGMGGYISQKLQKSMILLGAGIELKNAHLITKAYVEIAGQLDKNVTFEKLKQLFNKQIEQNKGSLSLHDLTVLALDNGVKLPYDFISLNRGMVIIDKMLEEVGSEQKVSKISKAEAVKNPTKIVRTLLEYGLTLKDLAKLGFSQLGLNSLGEEKMHKYEGLRCEGLFH